VNASNHRIEQLAGVILLLSLGSAIGLWLNGVWPLAELLGLVVAFSIGLGFAIAVALPRRLLPETAADELSAALQSDMPGKILNLMRPLTAAWAENINAVNQSIQRIDTVVEALSRRNADAENAHNELASLLAGVKGLRISSERYTERLEKLYQDRVQLEQTQAKKLEDTFSGTSELAKDLRVVLTQASAVLPERIKRALDSAATESIFRQRMNEALSNAMEAAANHLRKLSMGEIFDAIVSLNNLANSARNSTEKAQLMTEQFEILALRLQSETDRAEKVRLLSLGSANLSELELKTQLESLLIQITQPLLATVTELKELIRQTLAELQYFARHEPSNRGERETA